MGCPGKVAAAARWNLQKVIQKSDPRRIDRAKSMNLNFSYKPGSKIELWGGIECTVNRIRNTWMDQVARSGHVARLSDFDLFKDLGVTTLRHPILWERTAPHGLDTADWNWADSSLAKLRALEIRPIIGLVHHGSGPGTTDLLDAEFPEKLAAYAAAVAARYPWVQDFTPVNEPLTTARFSGLYGHWYPHAHDDKSFARALLNQCRAIVLAMRAIRRENPEARLIQTEDLGRIFSTPKLAYQAEFENERRWCSFDLLCGCVDRHHPMWSYFRWAGIEMSEVEWFLDNPCAPDLLGVNHYLSGERYLDEHLDRYPDYTHGGNGRDRYADVLAARVMENGAWGPKALLWETWQRYQLPIGVTECHNGCTREEQLRWFLEVWNAADELHSDGVNVVAVTAWSLLGAFNWHNLVTRDDGSYESGVFDIRSEKPRPTALVRCIRKLASGGMPDHPILDEVGWWKRPRRLVYGFSVDEFGKSTPALVQVKQPTIGRVRPLLISGSPGTLACAFSRVCEARGIAHHLLNRSQFDIADASSVRNVLAYFRPWAVINAAGYTRINDAELARELCFRENTEGPRVLAAECAKSGVQLITFSSDLVFNGTAARPYVESDTAVPLNYYGVTKEDGERATMDSMPSALIVRSGPFFGPWDEHNFLAVALHALAANLEFLAAEDTTVSPTYIPDLVNVSLDLLIDHEKGIWHLANNGQTSIADFVEDVAQLANVSTATLTRLRLEDLKLPAKRPSFSVLTSERAVLMPALSDATARFVRESQFRFEAPTSTREDDRKDLEYSSFTPN